MTLVPIHIIARLLGLVSGAVALSASKGANLHRKSGMIFGLTVGITGVIFGLSTGEIDGPPPAMAFVFGVVALLAVVGDVRMLLARSLP
jgi:uncharacterized membrane protein